MGQGSVGKKRHASYSHLRRPRLQRGRRLRFGISEVVPPACWHARKLVGQLSEKVQKSLKEPVCPTVFYVIDFARSWRPGPGHHKFFS